MFRKITLQVPPSLMMEMSLLYEKSLGLVTIDPPKPSGLKLKPSSIEYPKDSDKFFKPDLKVLYQAIQPTLCVSVPSDYKDKVVEQSGCQMVDNLFLITDPIGTKLYIYVDPAIKESKLTAAAIKLPRSYLEKTKNFYSFCFGMAFLEERHGAGPTHYASTNDNIIFELYPMPNTLDFNPVICSKNILPIINLDLPSTINIDAILKKIDENGGKILSSEKNDSIKIECSLGYIINLSQSAHLAPKADNVKYYSLF